MPDDADLAHPWCADVAVCPPEADGHVLADLERLLDHVFAELNEQIHHSQVRVQRPGVPDLKFRIVGEQDGDVARAGAPL